MAIRAIDSKSACEDGWSTVAPAGGGRPCQSDLRSANLTEAVSFVACMAVPAAVAVAAAGPSWQREHRSKSQFWQQRWVVPRVSHTSHSP